jgi:hypothetical protein
MMETYYYQIDERLSLEAEYTIDGADEGTDYAPPSNPSITLERVYLVEGSKRIEITEMYGRFFDVDWKELENEIEDELYNAK